MKSIANFWIKSFFAGVGLAFIKNLLEVAPPYLKFNPVQLPTWGWAGAFLIILFLTGPALKLIRWVLVFGLLAPVYFIGLNMVATKFNLQSDLTVLWLMRGFAISLAVSTYFYGWQLTKYLTFKFFWYLFAPVRFVVRQISPTWKAILRKYKKLPPCPIDIPLSVIDKFGNGDTYEQGRQFEEYVAQIYRVMGYHAKTTTQLRAEGKLPPSIQARGGSGEQGVDVVVPVYNQQSGLEERIIIQCKHYNKKVDNGAVQEIHSAKAMYNGQLAVVITNNYFTKPAQELAAANGVRLIDREGLEKLIQNATKKYYAQKEARKDNPSPKLVA